MLCSKGNSGPLEVHGKQFPYKCESKRGSFYTLRKLRILVQLVLDFSKFLVESYVQEHWLSCGLREDLCCQTVPFFVRMVHTTYQTPQQYLIAGSTALLLLLCDFYNLLLILALLR